MSSCAFPELADHPFDGDLLLARLEPLINELRLDRHMRLGAWLSTRELRVLLDDLPGGSLQE